MNLLTNEEFSYATTLPGFKSLAAPNRRQDVLDKTSQQRANREVRKSGRALGTTLIFCRTVGKEWNGGRIRVGLSEQRDEDGAGLLHEAAMKPILCAGRSLSQSPEESP